MYKLRLLLRKIHTPITIMLVPHSRFSSRSIKIPVIAAALFCVMACVGAVFSVSLTIQAFDYYRMKSEYTKMSKNFNEMESTMASLKESESQFRKLFSLGSRKEVLKNVDISSEDGSIDTDLLKKEIQSSMNAVEEIKKYLAKEQNVYMTSPSGWPAPGRISSGFGMREHPKYGGRRLHTGIDITMPNGTPLHATADGVVSFADRSGGNGNIVVIEHGHGMTSVYAHNSKNSVKPGQAVKRGEIIAYSGSTGISTGPHVHYEIWRNGQSVNPAPYLESKN
ncbi:MAG: M23 family metallopeptidase [Geobacteraceae bacterium]|nr:M23 family metallopeptidase [Geobacteraceae bacterium]